MNIDNKLVNHLAYLSRLKLTDAEKESLKDNLQKILSYVEELKSADVADVKLASSPVTRSSSKASYCEVIPHGANRGKPLVHSTGDAGNILREDTVRPCLPVDKALQNAPDRQGNFFRVPRVIETTDAH